MDYSKLKCSELRSLCADRGIAGVSRFRKEALVNALNSGVSYRRRLSTNIRNELWRKHFNTLDGTCYCCSATIGFDRFEAGHIVADARSDAIDNLRPICEACDRSITTNVDDFKNGLFILRVEEPDGVFADILTLRNGLYEMDRDLLYKINDYVLFPYAEMLQSPSTLTQWKFQFNELESWDPKEFKCMMDEYIIPYINPPKLDENTSAIVLERAMITSMNKVSYANIKDLYDDLYTFDEGILRNFLINFEYLARYNNYVNVKPCMSTMWCPTYFGDYLKSSGQINQIIRGYERGVALLLVEKFRAL